MTATAQKNPMDAGTVIFSALVLSAIGALFYNVMPLYLGTAQDSRGLDNSQIGFISSAFFLGYNLVTITAFYWIRKLSWRLITVVCAPIAALGLYASTLTEAYGMLLLATAIAGGAFAALYGVGTTILSDTSNPTRWYGLKIAAEGLVGAVLMLLLPSMLVSRFGFDGMVAGILLTMAVLAPELLLLPARGTRTYEPELEEFRELDALPESINHWAIWSALFATLVFFIGTSAVWAFTERLGSAAGFAPGDVGSMLAGTLVFATLGSLATAAIGKVFGNLRPFMLCLLLIGVALLLLGNFSTFGIYALGACLFAAAFGAGLPFALAEVAELDVDGRYVVLSVPAIGIGAMIGPGVAGMLYNGESATLILGLVAALMVTAAALMSYAALRKNG